MDTNSKLNLSGTLLDGGTTADAQIAYLRKNKKEIFKAVAPYCHESNKAVFDLIKPKITEIGSWRRETDKALRDMIRDAKKKKMNAKRNRGTVRTSGRPRKSSPPLQPSVIAAPNLAAAAPVAKRNEEPVTPPPAPIQQTTPVATAAPVADAPRPASTTRPFVSTTVRDLDLPAAIKTVLLSFVRSEDMGTLLLQYASVQADWRSVPMPADVYAAMEWIDAQLS